MSRTDLAFPYHVDGSGHTATSPYGRHVREMIELILFTSPGERVNRPDFGAGVGQLVFRGLSAELVATTLHVVQAELQRWLAGIVAVHTVDVRNRDDQLTIAVAYTVLASQEHRIEEYRL